ncbi:MAG: hypothetical protein H6Q65_2474, partial [Firmicutes bacterium]|nr:hypothetical protein [Bacillota bacterium]
MKVAMIINKDLPVGLIANASAVLGISLGRLFPEIVGADIMDATGSMHTGITAKTIPILGASLDQVKSIRDKLFTEAYEDVVVVDFSEIAQKCLDYENYTTLLSNVERSEIYYLGICLCGS